MFYEQPAKVIELPPNTCVASVIFNSKTGLLDIVFKGTYDTNYTFRVKENYIPMVQTLLESTQNGQSVGKIINFIKSSSSVVLLAKTKIPTIITIK